MEIHVGQSRAQLASTVGVSIALALFVDVAPAHADSILPPIGGGGGGQFVAPCPQGDVLTGFDLRAGDDIDAISPICIPAVSGQFKPYPQSYGGAGGSPVQVVCPNDTPVVTGMTVGYEGVRTITVNNIHLYCGLADATSQRTAFPSAVFDAPRAEANCDLFDCTDSVKTGFADQQCPVGQIAVGVIGRAGVWLDAVGLICGAPPAPAQQTVKAQGRVKLGGPVPAGPARPICDVAREARARNSPAAPGLEAQCAAQATVKAQARVKLGAQDAAPSKWTRPICDIAKQARARNSPAAPGLEAQCAAFVKRPIVEHDELVVKGEAIAREDPLAVELLDQQPDNSARIGFNVGMAIAEKDAGYGPGKQHIHDSLPAEEQSGFRAAVDFLIERNKYADFARKGAAIVKADEFVAVFRNDQSDVFYRLGFDIAMGFFSDPVAPGDTAKGLRSLAIRESLSEAGRRGFDAATGCNYCAKYRP